MNPHAPIATRQPNQATGPPLTMCVSVPSRCVKIPMMLVTILMPVKITGKIRQSAHRPTATSTAVAGLICCKKSVFIGRLSCTRAGSRTRLRPGDTGVRTLITITIARRVGLACPEHEMDIGFDADGILITLADRGRRDCQAALFGFRDQPQPSLLSRHAARRNDDF